MMLESKHLPTGVWDRIGGGVFSGMQVQPLVDAIAAEAWDEVDDLLNDQFHGYLLTDRAGLLEALSLLPEEWFDHYPRHRMTREIASTSGPMQLLSERAQRDYLEWVHSQEDAAARDRLALHTLEMRTLLATGNYLRAASKADDVHEFVETATDTGGFHDLLPPVLLRAGQSIDGRSRGERTRPTGTSAATWLWSTRCTVTSCWRSRGFYHPRTTPRMTMVRCISSKRPIS
jgi:hypothetical protein